MKDIRCGQCHALLLKAEKGRFEIKCRRCGTLNHFEVIEPLTPTATKEREFKETQCPKFAKFR